MKMVTANGKTKLVMSRTEWEAMGKRSARGDEMKIGDIVGIHYNDIDSAGYGDSVNQEGVVVRGLLDGTIRVRFKNEERFFMEEEREFYPHDLRPATKTAAANGKRKLVMSRSEWEAMGKKAGWTKKANDGSCPGCGSDDLSVTTGDETHCNDCGYTAPSRSFGMGTHKLTRKDFDMWGRR